jgi:hypothetical protein
MSEQTIFRTPREQYYTSVSNELAQDRMISFEARGLMLYLLSKPLDWKVQIKDLQQMCGRDRVYRILKELQKSGYILYEVERDGNKQVRRHIYRVYATRQPKQDEEMSEKPEVEEHSELTEPLPEKPDTADPHFTREEVSEKPDRENTYLTNNRDKQSTDLNKEKDSTTPQNGVGSEFPFHHSFADDAADNPIPFSGTSPAAAENGKLPPAEAPTSYDYDLMHEVVGEVFGIRPKSKHANVLVSFLRGNITAKYGAWHDHRIDDPPMSEIETMGLHLWWEQHYPGTEMQKPDTIREKIGIFRSSKQYPAALKLAEKRIDDMRQDLCRTVQQNDLQPLTGERKEDTPPDDAEDYSAEIDAAIGGLTDLVRSQQNRRPHE